MDRPRSARDGHGARSGRGCGGESGQRPPRHGDLDRPVGVHALQQGHAARPLGSLVVGPRPLRPVDRPFLGHPLQPALPHGLRPGAGGSEVAAHVGLAHAGPPRVRAHGGRGDHDRPARPGPGLRRRHVHGLAPRTRAARPRRPRRPVPLRPLRLRHRRRGRPRGGRDQRGLLARGNAAPGQPHRHLGRQPHLDRGRHEDRFHRGRPGSLRGLWLAHPARRLDERRRKVRGGRRGPLRCHREGEGGYGQAFVHPPVDDHGLALPHEAGNRRRPRREARRRGARRLEEGPGLRPGEVLRR